MHFNKDYNPAPYPSFLWEEVKNLFISAEDTFQKAKIAYKVGYIIEKGFLNYEKKILINCLEFLINQPDTSIKKILSTKLQYTQNLPHEIALSFCKEQEEIAIPILTHSPVLSDNDLIQMISTLNEQNKLLAISKRDNLNENVIDQFVIYKNLPCTLNILNNPSSKINHKTYINLFAIFYNNSDCIEAIFNRNELNGQNISQILCNLNTEASSIVRDFIKIHYNNNIYCYTDISSESSSQLTEDDNLIKRNIDLLFAKNQLNHALVIHYLCKCDLPSFLYCLAKLTNISFNEIKQIAFTSLDSSKFDELYKEANLPTHLLEAIKFLIKIIIQELEDHNITQDSLLTGVLNKMNEIDLKHELPEIKYLIRLISS